MVLKVRVPKPKPKPSAVVKPPSSSSSVAKSLGISAAAGGLAALPALASAYFASNTVDKVLENPYALTLLGGVALVFLLK
jgi:hypothetical protein